ncbi:MAG: nucleotidyltransferase domain-containing protein [Armatimonadetes bacterium]|nr:nucleotidyltransferase domain-containing protein [Armatimonadota bacterium]
MLTQSDRQIAREFRGRLASIVPVLGVWVYGSRARGDEAPDSDMDLFVEVGEITPEQRQRISEAAWEVGFEWNVVIVPVVATRFDLEHGPMGANPLVLAVRREGVQV